jgi:predicted nicotinamide N-methyase
MIAAADRAAFIRAHTRLMPVPHAPEISLLVADEATELWRKTEEELGEFGLAPPFWAFAWAGGQALARYLLDHPETVARRRVLDFAAGSGLVAIAAAKAGAACVEASDVDSLAIAAMELNAGVNGVAVAPRCADLVGMDEGWDVILAAYIFYERDTAERVTEWLFAFAGRGRTILIGDPGRSYLPRKRLARLAEYEVPVTRALEDAEIKRSSVWRFSL